VGGYVRGSYGGWLIGRYKSVNGCMWIDMVGGCIGMIWVQVAKNGLVDG
jgi:hypothetical protein